MDVLWIFLDSLEASLVSARVQSFTEQIGKFPNLDSAIEEHIEIWKCIDRCATPCCCSCFCPCSPQNNLPLPSPVSSLQI